MILGFSKQIKNVGFTNSAHTRADRGRREGPFSRVVDIEDVCFLYVASVYLIFSDEKGFFLRN